MIQKVHISILELIVRGDRLSISDYDHLRQEFLQNHDVLQSICLKDLGGLSSLEIDEIIRRRSQLLRSAYPEISQRLANQNIKFEPPSEMLCLLWQYWLPLAQRLAEQQQKMGQTLIQGLMGGQGTGKTTLGIVLNILLRHFGKTFLSISLDDIYKTFVERQKLRDRRPDLIWRGPPGTHDINLGIQVLQKLRDRHPSNPQEILIPRFDKSLHNGAGDRIDSEISYSADIVLFEGWFVGMRPLPLSAFRDWLPPILSKRDREFALECNSNLYDYLPLWSYLDSLILLLPKDYKYSLQWRLEAEHKLIITRKTGMSDQAITQFVEYFWKALHPEIFLPHMISSRDRLLGKQINSGPKVDLVIEISRSHKPTNIYRP